MEPSYLRHLSTYYYPACTSDLRLANPGGVIWECSASPLSAMLKREHSSRPLSRINIQSSELKAPRPDKAAFCEDHSSHTPRATCLMDHRHSRRILDSATRSYSSGDFFYLSLSVSANVTSNSDQIRNTEPPPALLLSLEGPSLTVLHSAVCFGRPGGVAVFSQSHEALTGCVVGELEQPYFHRECCCWWCIADSADAQPLGVLCCGGYVLACLR